MRSQPPRIEEYQNVAEWYNEGELGITRHQQYVAPSMETLLAYAKKAAAQLRSVVAGAETVRLCARPLLGGYSVSALEKKSALASEPALLTAAATDRARSAVYDITVERLARAQRNLGAPLAASIMGRFPAGQHSLVITVGMRSIEAAIMVHPHDTNENVLYLLCYAIRDAHAGIHATVLRNTAEDTVQLQLSAAGTGTDFAFEVTDTYGAAAAISGIDQVSAPAVNAKYRVNGGEARTSSSNTILLDNGHVLATLRGNAEQPVRVTVGSNIDVAASAVSKLVHAYNELLLQAKAAEECLNPEALHSLEQAAIHRGAPELGLMRQPNGSLHLEEERLRDMLTYRFDTTRRQLSGEQGFVRQLDEAVSRLIEAPTAALLHPNTWSQQAYPLYSPHGVYPAWLGMSGLYFNISY